MQIREEYENILYRLVGERAEDRPGMLEAVEEVCRGGSVILSAPPGYGKTNITYTLACLASKSLGPWPPRTVHVLPLRSIVEDVYRRLFEGGKPRLAELDTSRVARQMLGYGETPYLQKTLTLTTIDTYTLTQTRIPPGDALKIRWGVSLGHGEYSRAALAASTTVFDEIQLFLEEDRKAATVVNEVASWLSHLKTPTVIMSATLPRAYVEFLNRTGKYKVLRYGVDFRSREFEETRSSNTITFKQHVVRGVEEYSSAISKIFKDYDPERCLIIINTVKKAVDIAKRLKDLDPIVLHGKIISKERTARLDALSKKKRWTLISTQVVEAGVNISSTHLITEASTPTSLVQRAGRLLRDEESEEGALTIVYDALEEREGENGRYTVYPLDLVRATYRYVLEKGPRICWHLPIVDEEQRLGYEDLLEKVYHEVGFKPEKELETAGTLKKLLFKPTSSPEDTLDLLRRYGSIVRDTPLILGVVDVKGVLDAREGEEYPVEEVEDYILDHSFPLSESDVNSLAKTEPIALEYTRGYKLKLTRLERGVVVQKALRGDVMALLVPQEMYDSTYGFTGDKT